MLKKISIQGKNVLVTGANRGIGKEIVLALVQNGAAKVYAGTRKKGAMADILEKYADKVEEIQLDVTKQEDIDNAAAKIDTLDILINNAGVIPMGNFSNENALETLDANWKVNVRGLVAMTQAMFKKVCASNAGAIVSVSSIAGLGNMAFMGTYSASKSAVHSLMQGLRSELKDKNILVSTVYPGPVDTDMAADFEIEKARPEDVAGNIISGIQEGSEEIFPDAMSEEIGKLYSSSPKDVELRFASFLD